MRCGYQILKIIYKNKKLKLEKLLGQGIERVYFKKWKLNIKESSQKENLIK